VILKGVCPAEYPQNEKPPFLAGAEVVAIFEPPPTNLKMVKKEARPHLNPAGQHSTFNIQHSTFNIQHSTPNNEGPEPLGVECSALNVECFSEFRKILIPWARH
jgi:hypothetical protein